MSPDPVDAWIDALIARHTRALTTSEFLKAVRALSVRYVERRADLARRSPTDSAGKRAAFSAFYAPLHLVTVRAIAQEIRAARGDVREIVDLGCGTGAASAGWALACPGSAPTIVGVDRQAWALDEAAWNWRVLGLRGRTRREDLVSAAARLVRAPARRTAGRAMLLAWSVNELDDLARATLLTTLLEAARTGHSLLVVEPIAQRAVPWWNRWAAAWTARGGQAGVFTFDAALPRALVDISSAAGFRRETIGARVLWLAE